MATSNFDPNDNCKWWICLFTTSSNGERWCRHQLLASCEFWQKFSDFDHIRYPSNCQPQICIIHIHDSQMIIVGNVWIIFSQTLRPHSSKCHFPRSEKEKCDCFLTRGMVYRWKTMMTFIALMVMLMMNTVLMLMLMMSTVLMMICDYLKVGGPDARKWPRVYFASNLPTFKFFLLLFLECFWSGQNCKSPHY